MVSVVAGWEDRFHKPGAICAMIRVERCGLVRSNVLQRQPVLILGGRLRREPAEDDDGDSNQHRCEQTYGGVAVDVLHILRVYSRFDKSQVQKWFHFLRFCYLGHTTSHILAMYQSSRCRLARDLGRLLRRLPEKKSIDANRPHGQPGAQLNAHVLQRKIISAPVKRQSLQSADHLVAGPKAGAVANNRS